MKHRRGSIRPRPIITQRQRFVFAYRRCVVAAGRARRNRSSVRIAFDTDAPDIGPRRRASPRASSHSGSNSEMFRLIIAALAAAALSPSAQAAESKEPKIKSRVAAKTARRARSPRRSQRRVRSASSSSSRRASGASVEDLSAPAHVAATRAAVKSQVKAALDSVLTKHKLAHVGNVKGAPALVRLDDDSGVLGAGRRGRARRARERSSVVSIQYDRRCRSISR